MTLFVYDRLIDTNDFCNYTKEQAKLLKSIERGTCIRVFAERNSGKTSLFKNIIAHKWLKAAKDTRIVLYADFYSVENLDDISFEFTKAFSRAFSDKKNLVEKSSEWIKTLTHIRPTWSPAADGSGLGEFSIRADSSKGKAVDFAIILENVNAIQKQGRFNFFLILDEFQEIAKIPKAEAKLRDALQNLSPTIPVVIMGSKNHLLKKIFEKPNSPFHNWGSTFDMPPIPYEAYTLYANERLSKIGKSLPPATSIYLQDSLGRNPEAMNRFCDYLATQAPAKAFTIVDVNRHLAQFMEESRSVFSAQFATLSKNERKIVIAMAKKGHVTSTIGKDFLDELEGISVSGVRKITEKLLDNSVLSRVDSDTGFFYKLSDPLFEIFIKKYQTL